jgi:Fur family peroxide stress response transcriptional regulator
MEQKTKQFRKRNAILTYLQETHLHPSAEMLHEMLQAEHPDISLATVYRNLTLFKNQGLIQSLGTVDGIERFDANTLPHVHFICTSCNAVIDLPQIAVPEQLRNTVEQTTGSQVEACQLCFTGICQACCQSEKTA